MLPRELLDLIFHLLPKQDLFAVNLVCHEFKLVTDPLLYKTLFIQWSDLPLEHISISCFAEQLVFAPNASGEWSQSPKLARLEAITPKLRSLSISALGGSTGWLKYTGTPKITELYLRAVGNGLHFFDFEHVLDSFPHLKTLSLENFSLQPPPRHLPWLVSLTLMDCTWAYPMELRQVANLRQLFITLTERRRPFSLSERLQFDANHLPNSIESLHIHIYTSQAVGWKPLATVPANLRELSLVGFRSLGPEITRLMKTW